MNSFIYLYSEDIDKTINYSAKKIEKAPKGCLTLIESYQNYVFEARRRVRFGEKYAEGYFKRHLDCWNDKDIYVELATFYTNKNKPYLAELTLKKSGVPELYNNIKELNAKKNMEVVNGFWEPAKKQSLIYKEKYHKIKHQAITMFVLGGLAAGTGLGLFIHDKAFNGTNSLSAQYSLIIGGLTIINIGVLRNSASLYSLNASKTYNDIYKNYSGYSNTLPEEYFIHSGADTKTKKNSAKIYKKHGASLIFMSLPLFAISIYGYFDSYNYLKDIDWAGSYILFSHSFQLFSFAPAILSLTGGIIMLAKASEWEKLSSEPSLFTLNNITPIINPVSKTYGLALGFSF